MPSEEVENTARQHDLIVEDTFALVHRICTSKVRLELDSLSARQLRLPSRYGGLGFISALLTAPAAYAGSCALSSIWLHRLRTASVHRIQNTEQPVTLDNHTNVNGERVLEEVLQYVRNVVSTTFDPLSPEVYTRPAVPTLDQVLVEPTHKQRLLSDIIHQCAYARLVADAAESHFDRARLAAVSHPKALRAFAIPHKGSTRFNKVQWCLAVKLALGLDICITGHKCPACQADIDSKGVHLLTCKSFRGRQISLRHDCVVRQLKLFLSRAGAHVHVPHAEEIGWFMGERRPDIVVDIIEGPQAGHSILFDVTVTHPCRASLHGYSECFRAGGAATLAERHKVQRYQHRLLHPDITKFIPLGFDAFGGWGDSTSQQITDAVTRLAADSSTPHHVLTDWLCFQLSAAIWLYNAKALSTRVQSLIGSSTDENLTGFGIGVNQTLQHASSMEASHVVSVNRGYAEV